MVKRAEVHSVLMLHVFVCETGCADSVGASGLSSTVSSIYMYFVLAVTLYDVMDSMDEKMIES